MARSDNAQSALWMIGSMTAFAAGDTLIKLLGSQLPLPQVIALRGICGVVLVFVLARSLGALRWRLPARDWGLIAVRSVADIGTTFFFLTALVNMKIANATAVMQMAPLTITLAGAVFLREHVGWRRWSAIVVGFGGMILIVGPASDDFNAYSVFALVAVGFVTVRDLTTRALSPAVPSMLVTLINTVNVMIFGFVWSLFHTWQPVDLSMAVLIVGSAMTVVVAYLCGVMTIRVGEMSAAAPFRYSGLLVALILGYVVFGEWPTTQALLGAAIVVATGVYTLLREAAVAR